MSVQQHLEDAVKRVQELEKLRKFEGDEFAKVVGRLERKMVEQQVQIMRLEDLKLEQMQEIVRLTDHVASFDDGQDLQ